MADQQRTSRLTVLISGNGSNLQALIDATGQNINCDSSLTNRLPSAQIVRVISNRKKAYGLERATDANIPTLYHNLLDYKKRIPDENSARTEYDRDLANLILQDKPHLVICAGWMHILAPAFLNILSSHAIKVINLHPALPGHFNGANAIERAYVAFQKGEISHTGVMIHHVISEVDMGTPIVTRKVEINKGETLDQLEARIHTVEHALIVEGTAMVIEEIREKELRSGTRDATGV